MNIKIKALLLQTFCENIHLQITLIMTIRAALLMRCQTHQVVQSFS